MNEENAQKLKVKRSSAGLGLFALVEFKKGDSVVEYSGERITTEEADERGGKYLARLNKDWTIDGKGRDNLARYINHACKPNCFYEMNEEETRIFAIAKRKIKPGEELSVNYGKAYFEEHIKPHGCKCPSCTS